MREIYKVGGVIRRGEKLLVVRKRGTSVFIAPGGKCEPGEEPADSLRRELFEELALELLTMEFLGRFSDVSAFEAAPITMDVFLVECAGEPRPGAEIDEYRWVSLAGMDAGVHLGSVLERHIIPELRRKERISSQ